MKEASKTAKNMDMVNGFQITENFLLVNGKMVRKTVMEFSIIKMDLNTLVNGKMVKNMGKGPLPQLMAINI